MDKNKVKEYVEKHGGKILVGSLIFLAIGIAAFVIGFVIAYGWAVVLAWFGSRWALLLYLFIAIYIFLISFLIHMNKMKDR